MAFNSSRMTVLKSKSSDGTHGHLHKYHRGVRMEWSCVAQLNTSDPLSKKKKTVKKKKKNCKKIKK